jgi:hypothetical protein
MHNAKLTRLPSTASTTPSFTVLSTTFSGFSMMAPAALRETKLPYGLYALSAKLLDLSSASMASVIALKSSMFLKHYFTLRRGV